MKRSIILILAGTLLLSCTGCGDTDNGSKGPAKQLPKQCTAAELEQKGIGITYESGSADTLHALDGPFIDTKITNEEEALQAVASLSDMIGCKDFYDEIRLYTVDSSMGFTHYIFAQYYEDIPFMTHRIILHVNEETQMIEYLTSAYIPEVNVSTKPDISTEDAKLKAEEAVPDHKFTNEPELALITKNKTSYLIWACSDQTKEAFAWIDAHSGEVLYSDNGERTD